MKRTIKKMPVVMVYVSGGNVQGIRSNIKKIAVEVFDVDNKKAEGKNEDQIELEWQELTKIAKHPIY